MFKSIIVILGLFAIAQCAFRPSDLELAASTNGQVTLTHVPGAGYALPVDFSRNSVKSTYMLLALFTSKTLFTETCLEFNRYDCIGFDFCERDTKTYEVDYPHFRVSGNLVNTQAYVDYNNWALVKGAPAMIATNCQRTMTQRAGAGTYGYVGLGFADGNQKSFLNMVSNFAIFYSQNAFRLKFNDNLNFRKNLIAKVSTNANWGFDSLSVFHIGTFKRQVRGFKTIFDINNDATGVPGALFNDILTALKNNFQVSCDSGVWTEPTCRFNGNTAALPQFKLEINFQTNILITPQMYVKDLAGTQFKLNFRALDSSLAGINYVTKDFQDTVIIGNSVLRAYYTSFNLNDRSVSFYQVL